MSDEAQRAALARLLLDVQRQPGLYALAARQPAALFEGMPQVLQWAAGRQLDVMASTLARTEADLQHAAMWLVRQTCLRPGADALTVLGLAPGFNRASLREHYRLLIRLMHPDFMAAHQGETPWPDDAAQRINTANDALLRRLGDADEDPGEPEPVVPPAPVTPAAPAYVPPQPAPGGYPRAKPATTDDGWSWDSISPRAKMAGAATGALLCAVALVWGNSGSGGSRLVARAPSSTPTNTPMAKGLTTDTDTAMPESSAVVTADTKDAPRRATATPPQAAVVVKPMVQLTSPAPDVAGTASAPADTKAAAPQWWETTTPLPEAPSAVKAAPVAAAVPLTAPRPDPLAEQAPTPPTSPTQLGMLDVQVTMTNLVAHLGAGRLSDALALVASNRGNGADFATRYRQWLGENRVQGMGVVTMEARPQGHQLWVDGTVEVQLLTPQGQTDRRFLPFRAAFEGEPKQASLVSLALRQGQP